RTPGGAPEASLDGWTSRTFGSPGSWAGPLDLLTCLAMGHGGRLGPFPSLACPFGCSVLGLAAHPACPGRTLPCRVGCLTRIPACLCSGPPHHSPFAGPSHSARNSALPDRLGRRAGRRGRTRLAGLWPLTPRQGCLCPFPDYRVGWHTERLPGSW